MESKITGCEFLGYSQSGLPRVRLNTDDIYADEPPDEIMVCIAGKDEFYAFEKNVNCRNVYLDDEDNARFGCENGFTCSKCGGSVTDCEGYRVNGTFNYCPSCGAKVER